MLGQAELVNLLDRDAILSIQYLLEKTHSFVSEVELLSFIRENSPSIWSIRICLEENMLEISVLVDDVGGLQKSMIPPPPQWSSDDEANFVPDAFCLKAFRTILQKLSNAKHFLNVENEQRVETMHREMRSFQATRQNVGDDMKFVSMKMEDMLLVQQCLICPRHEIQEVLNSMDALADDFLS